MPGTTSLGIDRPPAHRVGDPSTNQREAQPGFPCPRKLFVEYSSQRSSCSRNGISDETSIQALVHLRLARYDPRLSDALLDTQLLWLQLFGRT